jgi:hypothetical protein
MKVECRFPPDVAVTYDKNSRTLTLTPAFLQGQPVKRELLYATTVGDAGARLESWVQLNRNNGELITGRVQPVIAGFDEQPPSSDALSPVRPVTED